MTRRCVPPALAAVVLCLLPLGALGDECPAGSVCLTESAVRQCDADQAELPELRVQLRVAEQRLVVALGDALVLSRTVEAQSALVVDLRRELLAARPWLPAWGWWAIGVGVGVAASVALALAI